MTMPLRRRAARLLTLAACAAMAAGCAVSSYTTADTLPAGASTFWVAPQLMRVAVAGAPQSMPLVELGTRHGLRDGVELGARLGAGAQLDVKLALRQRKAKDDRWSLALAPGVGYIGNFSGTPTGSGGDDLHFVGATVPLYASYRVAEALTLTAAPRVLWLMQAVETSSAATTHTFGGGCAINAAWRVRDGVTLVPEVSLALPFLRALTGTGAVAGTGGQRVLQVGVAVVLGG